MIKLKSLIKEIRKIPVVVGVITPQGEILSQLILGGSHGMLKYYFGNKWRYNPETKIVYWSSINWGSQTNDDMVDVENYLHKKYGYDVKDHIDMSNPNGKGMKYINTAHGIMIENLLENKLRGEWWIEDGQAIFADGDVGDMNHEAIVINHLRQEIYNALSIDNSRYEYAPDPHEMRDDIFQEIGQELTPEELEMWEQNETNEVIMSYLKREGNTDIENIIYYIRGHDKSGKTLDIRNYALVNWGWQRVKGNVIQTQTLTSGDISNIINGLSDAYGEELNDTDEDNVTEDNPTGEHTFDIEVMATRSFYLGIPWSILEKKNPTSLNPYRSRY